MISDGTQTSICFFKASQMFESDVISDGTQTFAERAEAPLTFESDVISDGTQTLITILYVLP